MVFRDAIDVTVANCISVVLMSDDLDFLLESKQSESLRVAFE